MCIEWWYMRFIPISGSTFAQMAESSSVLLMTQLLHAWPGIGPTGGLSESLLASHTTSANGKKQNPL